MTEEIRDGSDRAVSQEILAATTGWIWQRMDSLLEHPYSGSTALAPCRASETDFVARHMPVILALGWWGGEQLQLTQEDHKLEVSLSHVVRPGHKNKN